LKPFAIGSPTLITSEKKKQECLGKCKLDAIIFNEIFKEVRDCDISFKYIDSFFMSISKRASVTKLQLEINKELANLQIKRNFSLTTLPSQTSLRSSFSKSVKSIFFDEASHNRKNQSFKNKSPSPQSTPKEPKLGRSQDVIGLKVLKSQTGKLKKKSNEGMTRSFAQLSRKHS
jgi:hypothetical protein